MRSKFLFLCLFLLGTLTACKDTKWVDVPTGTPPEGAVTGKPGEAEDPEDPTDPTEKTFINCSYIRGDFFEINRISGASMGACNDLIYLTARPYADGNLTFDLPVNDAELTGAATYASSFNGRNGVLKFDGTGKMNGGEGLLHSPDGAYSKFTFGTYIYISEWVDGACLFKKMNGNSTIISFGMGATEGNLKLAIGSSTATVAHAALKAGAWHYVAVTYDKGTAKLYVDTNNTPTEFTGSLPASVANTRADFLIGENLKGYLDETFVSSLVVGTLGRNPISFNTNVWNNTKTLAYWKYDDSANPGKDSHTWAIRLDQIRNALNGQTGDRKLRLGVAGGEWLKMVGNETARTNFANHIRKVLEQYNLDGVDLDFEWAYSSTDLANYSKAIVKLRDVLGKDVCLTVSLHPVSYKITPEAIAAVDFISYQCYGPQTALFSFERFQSDGKAAVDYGIPQNKLVMGVPFYGTTGTAGEQAAYYDLIHNGNLNNTSVDEWTYNGKNYVLNSQNTIRRKTQYVCENGYGGIMSWDLATDVDITHDLSLLKVVKEEFDYYANPDVE